MDSFVLLEKRLKLELLEENDAHEEQAKDAISKVAEHVVEVTDKPQRFPGEGNNIEYTNHSKENITCRGHCSNICLGFQ